MTRGAGLTLSMHDSRSTMRDCLLHVACCMVPFVMAACAARVPPPLSDTLRHPEFIYPAVPENLKGTPEANRVDAGWRFLQAGDLRNAEREFASAMKRSPSLYPARAGAGYVDLARRAYEPALADFTAALVHAPRYLPALVGRAHALVGLKRDDEALAAFEAALAVDSSLTEVRRRIDVLRFRSAQEAIEGARAAAKAGRLEDARAAYRRAIDASPDSPLLHRELGIIERRRGDSQAALTELRKAVDLDPSDATSLIHIGEILEQRLDFVGAESMYREAAEIEPSDALAKRIEATAEKARLAKLPSEFHAIPESPQITRGDLAALIGIRLEPLLQRAQEQQVVITDARGHWAAPWIAQVARAGVIELFANHTFQPRGRVRRGDLAAAVSRLVLLATADAAERREAWATARPKIADMPPGHLSYPAVSVAVASGVMPLDEGDRFAVTRPVSGAEAIDTVERVAALARDAR
jgi:tetratricopeptide (TPR) repeat protein